MSGIAAGLTVFCIFLIGVTSSSDPIASAESCFRCQIFTIPSGQLGRDAGKGKVSAIDLPKDKKELHQYCLKACPHLFTDQTEGNPTNENKQLEPDRRSDAGLRKVMIPGAYAFYTIKYYTMKMMVIFGGILDCAINNTASVIEATLELPQGTFGMMKCDRLDLPALGVPSLYVKIIQTIARILIPRTRGGAPENHIPESLSPISPDRGFFESAKNIRRQKRAAQWGIEKN